MDLADIAAGELIRINLADAARDALAAGQTRITLSLQLNSPNPSAPLTLFSPQDVTHRTGLDVRVAQQDGVLADIDDAQGGLLAQGQSIIDLRTFEAGTFFLRSTIPSPTSKHRGAVPPRNQSAVAWLFEPLPDHDVIDGGDGDDVVIGNNHVDQLTGDRGDDTFIAEPGEVRDAESGEDIVEPPEGEKITPSQSGLKRLDVEVEFAEEAVQVAVARALGIPVTTQADNTPLVQEPILASQMATLAELNLSGLGISNLTGSRVCHQSGDPESGQ